MEESKTHNLLFRGDFNLPKISWYCDECFNFMSLDGATSLTEDSATYLQSLFATLNLFQCHSSHAKKDYRLDLVFATLDLLSYDHSSDSLVPWEAGSHEPATFSTISGVDKVPYNYLSRYNFKKIDKNQWKLSCQEKNWIEILDFNKLSVNGCVDVFIRFYMN